MVARKASPGETRRRILEAAERVMQRRGVAQLRIHEIASEAGLSQGGLYRHFEGKEDLLLAVILESVPRVGRFVEASVDADADAEQALHTMILAVVEHEERMASVALTVLADEALHRRFREVVTKAPGGPQDFLGLVGRHLAQHQRAGHLHKDLDPTQAAATIQARCFHHAVLGRLHGDQLAPETPDQLAAALVAQLLRPRPARGGASEQ